MKLTPMASIRINTWPGPGTGIGSSANSSTSGPPVSRIWMAFITRARMQRKGGGLQVKQGIGSREQGIALGSSNDHQTLLDANTLPGLLGINAPNGMHPRGACSYFLFPIPCFSVVAVCPI